MKKRGLALALAAMMITGLAACGNQGSSSGSGSGSGSTSGGGEEQVTIKLGYTHGTSNPEESDEVMYAQTFKEYVEANGMTTTDAIIDALDAYLPAKKTE